jgi:hypothetical protein
LSSRDHQGLDQIRGRQVIPIQELLPFGRHPGNV